MPSWNLTPSRSLKVHDSAVGARLPRLGEPWDELGAARLERDERLEDLVEHAQRLAVRDERAVEHDRIRGGPEDELVAALASATAVVSPTACHEDERHRGKREDLD